MYQITLILLFFSKISKGMMAAEMLNFIPEKFQIKI